MDGDVQTVLSYYPTVARPTAPPEPLGNAGGLSGSRLWQYRSGLGPLVVRAWPEDGPARSTLEEIHGWLSEAGRLGFIPVPVRGLDGRTLYEHAGRFWELTPWLAGTAGPAEGPTPRRVAAAFSALAAFHQRLAGRTTEGASPGLQVRLREVDWLAGGGLSVFEAAIARRPDDPVGPLARRWVEAAGRSLRGVRSALERGVGVVVVRQPCLRDVRPEHFLFTGDRVTGLVDFGAMGLDTVAADLARLASEWLGRDPSLRATGFAAYDAVRRVAPEEAALIDVFERSAGLLGAGHWVRWHFVEGRGFEDPGAVARGLGKGLARLEGRSAG